jgi:hypothetical protein
MIPVTLFNANPLGVTVVINGGASNWIGGTNRALRWRPQTFTGLTMNPGDPAPGVLGIGQNTLSITPQGALQPASAPVSLPDAFWSSVQLYVFYDTTSTASWLILNGGEYVLGGPFLP